MDNGIKTTCNPDGGPSASIVRGEPSPYSSINIDKSKEEKCDIATVNNSMFTDRAAINGKAVNIAAASDADVLNQIIAELSPSHSKDSFAKRANCSESDYVVKDKAVLESSNSGVKPSDNMKLMMEIVEDAMSEGSIVLALKRSNDSLIELLTEKLNAALALIAQKSKQLEQCQIKNYILAKQLKEETMMRECLEAAVAAGNERGNDTEDSREIIPLIYSSAGIECSVGHKSVYCQTDQMMALVSDRVENEGKAEIMNAKVDINIPNTFHTTDNSNFEGIYDTERFQNHENNLKTLWSVNQCQDFQDANDECAKLAYFSYMEERSDSSFVGDPEVLRAIEMSITCDKVSKSDESEQIISKLQNGKSDEYWTRCEEVGCQTNPISLTLLAISQQNNSENFAPQIPQKYPKNVYNSVVKHRMGESGKIQGNIAMINEWDCCDNESVISLPEPCEGNNQPNGTTYYYRDILREYNDVEHSFKELISSGFCLNSTPNNGYKNAASLSKCRRGGTDPSAHIVVNGESLSSITYGSEDSSAEELSAAVRTEGIIASPVTTCCQIRERNQLAHRLRIIVLSLHQELKQSFQRENIREKETDFLCETLKNRSEALFRVSRLLEATQGFQTDFVDPTTYNRERPFLFDFPGAELRQRYMITNTNNTHLTMRTISLMMTRYNTSKKHNSHLVQEVQQQKLQISNYTPKSENLSLKTHIPSLQNDDDKSEESEVTSQTVPLLMVTLPPAKEPKKHFVKSSISTSPEHLDVKSNNSPSCNSRKLPGSRKQYSKPPSDMALVKFRRSGVGSEKVSRMPIVPNPKKQGMEVFSHSKGVPPNGTPDLHSCREQKRNSGVVLSPPNINAIRNGEK